MPGRTLSLRRKQDTRDFVTSTGRDKVERMLETARRALLDRRGRVRRELLRPVKCEVCGGGARDADALFEKDAFHYQKCRRCGLIYMNPQLNEDLLIEHYVKDAAADAWVDVLLSPSQFGYDRKKFDLRLAAMEKYVEPGHLLDIGCSIGHFLKVGRDRGWTPCGLEFNERAVKVARDRFGITTVQRAMLDEARFPAGRFSGIGLWGVLEHIARPRLVLREMMRILAPRGVVVISVPNGGSLAVRVIREKAACFNGVGGHLWFFSPATLPRLLQEEGYQILEVGSEQPELDTIWNYLNHEDPYRGNVRLPVDERTRRWIEEALLEQGLGYKLVVLARKPAR